MLATSRASTAQSDGVEYENGIPLRVLGQRNPGIAQNHTRLLAAAIPKREVLIRARNPLDGGIDFVERPGLVGFCGRGQ
jgi:hypothetical protein